MSELLLSKMSYTYCLKHIPTGFRYYGYSQNDHKQFWKTYFGSSELVWFFIKRDGIESFEARVTRVFDFPWQARDHEGKFLRRTKVISKMDWLNCTGRRHKFGFNNRDILREGVTAQDFILT